MDIVARPHKITTLVHRALALVPYSLNQIEIFHTDRGSKLKYQLIEKTLETFDIERSLSEKETPYDNAVAEEMFKTIKIGFNN